MRSRVALLQARMVSMHAPVVLKLFGRCDVDLRGEFGLKLTLPFTSTDTPHTDSPRNLLSV